jgi:hypothetical protein
MSEFMFKIWYMIAVLPFLILIEASDMFANFLKKKNIYSGWDMFHTVVVVLLIVLVILLLNGFRP